jgi:hypothetical protein
MNYGIITNPSAAQVQVVQSADPTDLQNLVNAALLAINGLLSVITNITLAGGGDGHTFVVLIESALFADAQGALAATIFGVPGTQVRCYLAGTGEDLEVARTAAGTPPPIPASPPLIPFPIPYVLSDEQVAGSSKGTRFMGMTVFAASSLPIPLGAPIAQTSLLNAALVTGGNPLDIAFVPVPPSNGFSVIGAGAILRYDGGLAIEALVDVSVVVTVTAAAAFPVAVTVSLLKDPGVTPVSLAQESIQIFSLADNIEAVSFPSLALLLPPGVSLADAQLGVRVTSLDAAFTGSALGFLRVAAR